MPPRTTRNSNRKACKVDEDEDFIFFSSEEDEVIKVKPKRKKRKTQKKKETSDEEQFEADDSKQHILDECEAEKDDEFLQAILNSIKQMKDPLVLGRLFSEAKTSKSKKNLSIQIVRYLRKVSTEFLVSISQAKMFMENFSIPSIDQNNICLMRIDVVEVWAVIFSFLPIQSFFVARSVCKLWYDASELPHALTHFTIPFSIWNKSEKLFFDKFISHRIPSIASYENYGAIPSLVNHYGIKAKPITKKDTQASDFFGYMPGKKHVSLHFRISTEIIDIFKSPSSIEKFPALKHLRLESNQTVKEITISHPILNSLELSGVSHVTISCPMLESCTLRGIINSVTITTISLKLLLVTLSMLLPGSEKVRNKI